MSNADFEPVLQVSTGTKLYRLKKSPMQQFDNIFQQAISEIEPVIHGKTDRNIDAGIKPIARVFDFQKGSLTSSSWAFAMPLPRKRNTSADVASKVPEAPKHLSADVALKPPMVPQVIFLQNDTRTISNVRWKPFSEVESECEGYLLESGITMTLTGEGISMILIQWRGDFHGEK